MPGLMRFTLVLALAMGVQTARHVASADPLNQPEKGKKIRVFLFAGQSNMEGRANGRLLTEDERERLERVQPRVQLAYNQHPVKPVDVVEPPADIAELYKVDRIFGPELFFGVRMAELWPDEKILLIKFAFGATSLYGAWNPDWSREKAERNEDVEETRLYTRMVAYVKEVLSNYVSDQYEICAMFWVQGEGDGKLPEAAASYGSSLQTLIDGFRKATGKPDLPFLLLQVGADTVVAGMRETAATVHNVTLLPQSQDPASPDFYEKIPNGHYNHVGMKKLGERFAEEYLSRYATPAN